MARLWVALATTVLPTAAPMLLRVSISMNASISTAPLVVGTELLSALKFGSSSSLQTTGSATSNGRHLVWRARSQSCWSLAIFSSRLYTSVGRSVWAGEGLSMETEREGKKKKEIKEIKKKEKNHGKGCLGGEKTREKWEKGEAVKIYLKKNKSSNGSLFEAFQNIEMHVVFKRHEPWTMRNRKEQFKTGSAKRIEAIPGIRNKTVKWVSRFSSATPSLERPFLSFSPDPEI